MEKGKERRRWEHRVIHAVLDIDFTHWTAIKREEGDAASASRSSGAH